MNEKKFLKIIDNDGKELNYEILCAFNLTKTGKDYIIYTDNTKDLNGNLNVYASIYDKNDDSKLETIETDEEWTEIEKRLNQLMNKN